MGDAEGAILLLKHVDWVPPSNVHVYYKVVLHGILHQMIRFYI
jgi:hypothetical protein